MNPNRERSKPEHNSHSQTAPNKSQVQASLPLPLTLSSVSQSAEATSVSVRLKGKYSRQHRVHQDCLISGFSGSALLCSGSDERPLLIVCSLSLSAEQGKLCELERSEERSEREAVFIFQAFLSFPVRLCCLCVCELALLSVGTISLQAWRATDVVGLHCCFPPAPTVPPLIHRESNPII